MEDRLIWVDQAKGVGVFLMIYAHNFPFCETYIYTFHMPLFFFISGMFHPKKITREVIIKRSKNILLPYFIWSALLYLFWLFLGRNYGNSVNYNLNPLNNFIGIFYAQGDIMFMDWGIPMWFLPCIFLTFILFSIVHVVKFKPLKFILIIAIVILGFIYPRISDFKLPWSIDVACVSLIFYSVGAFLKRSLVKLDFKRSLIFAVILLLIHVSFSFFNSKIDMYRSVYGSPLFFILNGISGSLFVLLFFKRFELHKILTYLGQNTIPLLALQLRALTVIKFFLIVIGISSFDFSEPIKFVITLIQIMLMLPILFIINKYLPILNGNIKK